MADISTSTELSDRLSNVKLLESWETVLESIHATFLCSSSPFWGPSVLEEEW